MNWIKEEAMSAVYLIIGLVFLFASFAFFDLWRSFINWLWGVNDESR